MGDITVNTNMLKIQRLSGCSRLFSAAAAQEFNKTEEDGVAHVTSINANSGDRSIIQISKNETRIRRFRREFHLPDEAITGLRQALIASKRTPKQIQHEADELNERLNQRSFPASPQAVKKVRDKLKESLSKNKEYDEPADFLGDHKIKEAQEYELRHKVDKIMKKTRYNWKPLEFDSAEMATTYALARLSANYTEISRCLEELPDFNPNSVLDFGSGCGAGYWAVKERFPNVKEISLIDTCDNMTKISMDIMRNQSSQLIDKRVQFRRHLLPSLQTTYDLVIGHRILSEIGSEESRIQLIESLWSRTNKYLVLIESAQGTSFEALLNIRDYLLVAGTTVNKEVLFRRLKKREEVEKVQGIVNNNSTTDIEKFSLLQEIVPEDVDIPTVLPTATVVAPCPHDLGCPLRGKSTCAFSVRWKPIRADGKNGPGKGDGTETGKFTFVILEKGTRRSGEQIDRILKMRKLHGHATCDVCTAFRGIQRITVSKRAGQLYQTLRTRRDGELFPLSMQTKATEGLFDLYDYGKSSASD